jgi:hypothetical protein
VLNSMLVDRFPVHITTLANAFFLVPVLFAIPNLRMSASLYANTTMYGGIRRRVQTTDHTSASPVSAHSSQRRRKARTIASAFPRTSSCRVADLSASLVAPHSSSATGDRWLTQVPKTSKKSTFRSGTAILVDVFDEIYCCVRTASITDHFLDGKSPRFIAGAS